MDASANTYVSSGGRRHVASVKEVLILLLRFSPSTCCSECVCPLPSCVETALDLLSCSKGASVLSGCSGLLPLSSCSVPVPRILAMELRSAGSSRVGLWLLCLAKPALEGKMPQRNCEREASAVVSLACGNSLSYPRLLLPAASTPGTTLLRKAGASLGDAVLPGSVKSAPSLPLFFPRS